MDRLSLSCKSDFDINIGQLINDLLPYSYSRICCVNSSTVPGDAHEVRVVAISVGYRKFARSSQGERWAGARALWGRLERTMPFENGGVNKKKGFAGKRNGRLSCASVQVRGR